MKLKIKKKESYDILLKKYFSLKNETHSLQPFSDIINCIKRENFSHFVDFLANHQEISENFGYYIRNIFKNKKFNLSLTEANILSENTFFLELKKRLLNSILPAVEEENTIWNLIDNTSVNPAKDLKYFKSIDSELLKKTFELLGISNFIIRPEVKENLLYALNVLAWRVIGNAMDIEVQRMVPEYQKLDNPFIALQNELDQLITLFKENNTLQLHSKDTLYKQIKIYLSQCLEFVTTAFKNSSKYGISSKINQSLLKIQQQIKRMQEIIILLVIDKEEDIAHNSQKLFLNILEYKSRKNNLKEFADDSTRLLSHLITNHTAETGSHYITYGKKGYLKMFWKASGGGMIVGFLCILKLLYSYSPSSDFIHALLYAFNYAMGFVMIYLMHYTLATKQPAMTATTMAKALSYNKNTQENYNSFATIVSRLFRTQFIAFVGNVLWAMPMALILIYGLDVIFNMNFANEKSDKLLKDLNPFESKAILHASLAGFFLFISGIIAGNSANNNVFHKIPQRISQNQRMKRFFGKNFTQNLSNYYAKNWAGVISNIWFGVMLGVTAPIGDFLGLDLDIRHITFAAGNLMLGLYGKDFDISSELFWICFSTVFIIGFFNFIVSFGLSMLLALRSRKVDFYEFLNICKEVFLYFIKNPLTFFLPTSSKADDSAKEFLDERISSKK